MRRHTAEAIGTFFVMFSGCGAILVAGDRIGEGGIALAFGAALAIATAAFAPISGGHFNPAVSLAMALTKRIGAREALGYVASQLGGGALGALLAFSIAGGRPGGAPLAARAIVIGYDRLSPGFYGLQAAFTTELVLSALVVFAVLGAQRSAFLPAIAGLAYGLANLIGRPVTGLAVNPARALGPALLLGPAALEQLWLFVLAPLAGAALAAGAHRYLFATELPSAALPSPSFVPARKADVRTP